MAIAAIVFRGVLLPFLLAIVLAYVLSPLVAMGQRLRIRGRSPARWAVVLSLYLVLISMLAGIVAVSVPRLAAEFSRLTLEAPRAVATVREKWLPELEHRLRAATAPYVELNERLSGPKAEEAPLEPPAKEGDDEAVQELDAVTRARPLEAELREGIRVAPRAGGGFDVLLPAKGIRVIPDGEDAFRIVPAESPHRPNKRKADITEMITEAVAGTMENTERTALALLQAAQKLIAALTRGVFAFVMMLMISAYLLITSDRIFAFLRSLYSPSRRTEFDVLIARIDRGLAGVVRGQLIICAVNGVLSGVGFYVLDLKYWTFLTLVATVMSIIPIFGSILSTIPAVLVALPDGVGLALLVLAWIVLIHQMEANLLNPKIMGDSARVHPVLVVFALLAGEHVAGIIGALLAVPVLSITQTLFLYLREQFLGVPRSTSVPPPP